MAYFDELNTVVATALDLIYNDTELIKLLDYPEKITSPDNLLMKNIFPIPRDPNAISNVKNAINVYVEEAYPYDKNSGFRQACLNFDIMCHLDAWNMGGGKLRPYLISERIDTLFNNNFSPKVRLMSGNAPYFYYWKIYKFSEFFYGYRLRYYISLESNMGKKYSG